MNTSQGALYFGAGIDLQQWRRDVDSMRRDIVGLTNTTVQQTQQMDSAFKNLSVGIAGYFSVSALQGFAMELISVRGEFQKTEIAFSTMLGSGEKARVLMGQMVDLAAKTPFSLQDVSAGAKQLLAFQIPANQVVDVLTRMGNIAAGLGVPLSRINLVYGQVKAKGKLMGDDLRQFTEAGIPMVAELAKKFGKTTSEITEMVSAGKIGFKDVQDVLFAMTNEGGMFFNLMEKQSKSLSGQVANLGDAWDQMLNKIGQSSEGFLYGSIESLTYLIENYREVAEILLELVAAYGIYKAAVIATSVISTTYNKTIASEIALLGISDKMKLGRAMVTQRQTEATARDTAAELASTRAKYAALQVEVSSLAVKKQSAIQSGIAATAKAQEARVQLAYARMELSSIQATGTARHIEIAQKRVTTAQNAVIATQETASIARKRALAAATEFNAAKQQLENTAQAVGVAEKTAATAAEVAQVAAKNANAIATTRLTFLQNLQTLATRIGAEAQALLNRTILANPYALAAVLIAGMTYAIYKHATALTALQEIQNKFKEELSQTNVGVNEQITKLNSLIAVIKKQSTSYDEAKKILAQVNSLTNNRIEGLTIEAIKTGHADAAIKAYTKSLYRQAEVMLKVQEIAKLEEQRKKLKEDIADETFLERASATLNPFDANYFEKGFQGAKEKELKAIDKTLADYKGDVEKAVKDGLDLSGTTIEAEGPKVKLGILEGLNEELKAANEAIQKAGSDAEINKWIKVRDRIQAKIDSYGVKKKKPKEERQLAEIFPVGSPKQIQQQIQLLDEAMAQVEKGMVKIRKLDKYGSDKDKKGNPYLTGELVSLEEAGKRKEALEDKQKSLQYKNFQERIDESERQWNNFYKMSEFYGKATADAQYKDLFKGSQSYLQYLEKIQQALLDKQAVGDILSEKDKNNLVFIQDKINSLNGQETPLENFKRGIDNAVKSIPSLVDQLGYLEKAQDEAFNKEGSNSNLFLQEKSYLEQRKRDVLQSQKDLYNDFIKEQETFESKKSTIEQKYNDIRKKIGENSTFSDDERIRLLDTAAKEEAKEYSDAFLNVFKKTKLWEKAFSDIDSLTKKEISQLIPVLEAQISQLIKLDAPIAEIEGFRKKLEELKTFSTGSNPITRLIANFKELRKKIKEGTATQADFQRLRDNVDEVAVYVRMATEAAKELSEALGIGDKGGPFEKFAKDLTQTIEGLINAIVGYFTGNMQQMVGGIIQMVVGVIKMLSTAGDGRKEKSIRAWKRAVDDLKFAYEELQMIIEKTAGEGQLAMQRDLISNLKEQQRILQEMRSKESAKKKADQEKIAGFTQQINDINLQIQQLIDDFQTSVTTIEFKDFSKKIADALIDAFGKGENAAASFEKVVDDVMRNAVANALRIKILEPAVKNMVDSLYSSMGFGGTGGATTQQANQLKAFQDQVALIDKKLLSANTISAVSLNSIKADLLEQIKILQQQIAANAVSGSYDGLTQEERDKIKALGTDAMNQYTAALQQYQDLFGAASENAQGLKGDIKGITEKTAGALEGQFNAVRINIVAVLKIMQGNQILSNAQTALLSQIEVNTRNLHQMRKDLAEMNSKIKPGLAGIP
ncbi:tape measure protein [Chryseobacterium sp. RP-3-3]|uniref:Tape measure protein n=1 Tax=Chryseobacterium antibioticum TaxID=2728847 RepID=A0A7Y0AMD7_9FLAO|nr:tape measure protein [Chryseobacterium antibioticum]NML70027.1 tape measure protein [Chryseobacterium antibioticum]